MQNGSFALLPLPLIKKEVPLRKHCVRYGFDAVRYFVRAGCP